MQTTKNEGPSDAEIEKLRKAIGEVTAEFFSEYGGQYQFLLVGPEGPRPPPKLELNILNLSSY